MLSGNQLRARTRNSSKFLIAFFILLFNSLLQEIAEQKCETTTGCAHQKQLSYISFSTFDYV